MTPDRRAQIIGDLSAIFESILEDEPEIDRMDTIMNITGEALAAAVSSREGAAREMFAAIKRDPDAAKIMRQFRDEDPK